MTQIVVTLENGADSNMLRRMIENMRGVLKATVNKPKCNMEVSESDEWIQKMEELGEMVNPSIIDMTDARTRYIMSK